MFVARGIRGGLSDLRMRIENTPPAADEDRHQAQAKDKTSFMCLQLYCI